MKQVGVSVPPGAMAGESSAQAPDRKLLLTHYASLPRNQGSLLMSPDYVAHNWLTANEENVVS